MDIKYVEITEDLSFTEAALVETPPEEDVEENTEAASEEDSMDGELFTEAALVEPIRDISEIKAIAGIEARKAGAVAAAGAQAIALAVEKRESGTVVEQPQHHDSFADLEAVELMAIEMVKKEQETVSSHAASAAETAKAGETAEAGGTPGIGEEAADASESTDAPVCSACPACASCGEAAEAVLADIEEGVVCAEADGEASAEDAGEASAEAAAEVTAEDAAEASAEDAGEASAEDAGEASAEDAAEVTAEDAAEASKTSAPDRQSGNKASSGNSTVRVIGVRFRTAGKVYYFDPGQWQVRHGTHVIVETVRGIEYGTVVGIPMDVSAAKVPQPLKEVIRVATPEDTESERRNREKEREAYRICAEKIRAHGLEMKLINAEYTFDNSKVLFYFTADGRVDFRDLVKDLASVFRTRIELRQIGVRDETKILGGYGICGRPLCCHTWMSDFIPVSIKMAKEQSLSLNPGKISGVCGRLMCCLKNEADTYEELNRSLPKVGDEVQGKDGLSGQVESVNVLRQTVRILVEVDDEKEYHEYGVDDITVLRRRRRGGNRNRKDNADSKEVQELERLESQERQPSRGRTDRGNRGNGGNRADRGNREERGDGGNRQDRVDGGGRQDRSDGGGRQDRVDGGGRQDRGDRGNRQDRGDGYNGAERRDRRNNRRRNGGSQSET